MELTLENWKTAMRELLKDMLEAPFEEDDMTIATIMAAIENGLLLQCQVTIAEKDEEAAGYFDTISIYLEDGQAQKALDMAHEALDKYSPSQESKDNYSDSTR
jgi:hypothetical protein